ncbi:MAG: hypothetical protein JSW71_12040 [Gemmatimonadota bacterium]|nr:MAG: hypothetical protein JSW71_12040 [Gemmatimonadota bacterium]
MSDLAKVTASLRKALDDVEAQLTKGDPPAGALEDFKSVLDGIRTNVIAFVKAADSADYFGTVNSFRLLRATQICQNVLTGLVDGTISAKTPGFEKFQATISDVLERLGK